MRLANAASGWFKSKRAPRGEKFTCTPAIRPRDPTMAWWSHSPATKLPNGLTLLVSSRSGASTGEANRMMTGMSGPGGSTRQSERRRFFFPSTVGSNVARQHRMRVGKRHLPPAERGLVTNPAHAGGSRCILAREPAHPCLAAFLATLRPRVICRRHRAVRTPRLHPPPRTTSSSAAAPSSTDPGCRASPPTSASFAGTSHGSAASPGQKAATEIDATGSYVTPGFINIHSHATPEGLHARREHAGAGRDHRDHQRGWRRGHRSRHPAAPPAHCRPCRQRRREHRLQRDLGGQ